MQRVCAHCFSSRRSGGTPPTSPEAKASHTMRRRASDASEGEDGERDAELREEMVSSDHMLRQGRALPTSLMLPIGIAGIEGDEPQVGSFPRGGTMSRMFGESFGSSLNNTAG